MRFGKNSLVNDVDETSSVTKKRPLGIFQSWCLLHNFKSEGLKTRLENAHKIIVNLQIVWTLLINQTLKKEVINQKRLFHGFTHVNESFQISGMYIYLLKQFSREIHGKDGCFKMVEVKSLDTLDTLSYSWRPRTSSFSKNKNNHAIYIICFRLFPGTNKYVDIIAKDSEIKQ